MKRVLITGAAGLIGSVLRRELAGQYTFRGLDRMPAEGIESVVADIGDLDAIAPAFVGMDAVVHLAASADMSTNWDDALGINIIGTRNVFEAAHRAGVERVIYASSNHAVGGYEADGAPGIYRPGQTAHPLVDEHAALRPDSLYGVSKCFGEALGRYYADLHRLTVLCLRIGSVLRDDDPAGPGTATAAGWLALAPEERYWRQAATWLSHRDAAQLVDRCLATEFPRGHFDIFWVLPPFDDRLPLVLRVGMGESVAPSAHHRKAVADGQQFVLPLRISRTRIIECRQDPSSVTPACGSCGRKSRLPIPREQGNMLPSSPSVSCVNLGTLGSPRRSRKGCIHGHREVCPD